MYTTAFLRQFGEAQAAVSKLVDTIEEVFGHIAAISFDQDSVIVTDDDGNGVQTFMMTPAFAELIAKATSPDKPKRGRPAKTTAEPKTEEEVNAQVERDKASAPAIPPEPDPEPAPEPDPEEPAVAVSDSIRYYMTVEEQSDGIWQIREYIEGKPNPIVHGSENQMAAALRRAGEFRKRYDGDMNRLQLKPVETVRYNDDDPPF